MNIVQGTKYTFLIETSEIHFAIRAQCRFTGRFSYINNLNAILSELGISEVDPRVAESTWEVNLHESRNFAKLAESFLSSMTFLSYLEKQLDEDRRLGKWENIEL